MTPSRIASVAYVQSVPYHSSGAVLYSQQLP